MKRFIAAITSLLGLTASAAPETKMVDPKTIYFSLATLNDALPAVDPSTKPTAKDLVIHEDEWRQFEAIARTFDAQIGAEIADVQRIFKEKSKMSGEYRIFSEIHVRKRIPQPLPTPIVWAELLEAFGVKPTSIHGVGLRDNQGMVRGGFSFQVGQLSVYGVRQQEKVVILCFASSNTPGLSDEEAQKAGEFIEKNKLDIVHWPSATLLKDQKTVLAILKQKKG